jgi:hypothetical protein
MNQLLEGANIARLRGTYQLQFIENRLIQFLDGSHRAPDSKISERKGGNGYSTDLDAGVHPCFAGAGVFRQTPRVLQLDSPAGNSLPRIDTGF